MATTALDEYRLLGNSGLRVSPLCLGTMTFGEAHGFGSNFEESKSVFDAYVAKGGNFFDTANIYTNGDSERFLGQLIAQHRTSAVVATKFTNSLDGINPPQDRRRNPNSGGNGRKSLVETLDGSLKRMNIGYVDLLYVHMWEYRTPAHEVVRALDDVVRSGKALYLGLSDTPAYVVGRLQTIAELRGWSQFIALQSLYNILDRSMEGELGLAASELGLGTVPWGILADGALSGKYKRSSGKEPTADAARVTQAQRWLKTEHNWAVIDELAAIAKEQNRTSAQVAINWQLAQGITSPIVGARTVQQLNDNLAALDFTLTDNQLARINKVSKPAHPFPVGWLNLVEKGPFITAGTKVQSSGRLALFRANKL